MQDLLKVVALVGEDLHEIAQFVHLIDECGVGVPQEPSHVGEGLVERTQGGSEILGAGGQHLGHRRQMGAELHDLLIGVRQRVHQGLQVLDRAEQIRPRVTESACRLREFTHRIAEGVTIAIEGGGCLVDEIAYRPLGLPLRPQAVTEFGQLGLDLVPFDRDGGLVQPQRGTVLQCLAVGVGRSQLNKPCGHQIRRHDDGLSALGHLEFVRHLHGDLDVALARLDRTDAPGLHAQDPDVVARIQPNRRREMPDDLVGSAAGPHPVQEAAHECHGEHREGPTLEPGFRCCHGDFGLMIWRSPIRPFK
ncbi:Uncharacterised protein [Mycobacteroides abscessus subsp. massiliense]|nr:Uncharacterised protein [Mycobacteroides abscessus subsp. massiliense]